MRNAFRFGSDDSECYWMLVGYQRFARDPLVKLIDYASRHRARTGRQKYSQCYLKCLEARQAAVDAGKDSHADDATVNIGFAGAEVKLIYGMTRPWCSRWNWSVCVGRKEA